MDAKIIRNVSGKHNHPDEIEEIRKIRTISELKEKIKKTDYSLDFNIKRNNREMLLHNSDKYTSNINSIYTNLYRKKNKNLSDDFNSFDEIPEEH